ncbi:MAG: sugar ABC transporter ATP-binding protein [Armatimonadetes bacterium]|nr:sugar ABC transporter ATP-binding protein [Armatimonadota bacterium]
MPTSTDEARRPAPAPAGQVVLSMQNITKTYPGVRALENVDFEVRQGEVHALVGENGAGKSTLMKIMAGAVQRDSGEILLDGQPLAHISPHEALSLGIGIIYQEFNLVPYLSAAENIFLGREPRGVIPGFVDFKTMYAEAQRLLDDLDAHFDARRLVSTLSVAQQQMVEIAKATSQNVKVIAMDEPSATLTDHELASLFRLMRRLKESGVGIIYISHRLEEIFEICDRVTVLRDGKFVGTNDIEATNREEIIRMMVGRELGEAIPKVAAEVREPALEIRNLTRKGELEGINLTVRYGEVVGLAGLVGAGRTELARVIFGADPYDSGEILLEGKPVRITSPQAAINRGIGLVTEDRKQLGLVLGMTVRENTTLANLDELSRMGFIMSQKEREIAQKYIKDLSIRTPSQEQEVKNLSGGNQQKVVLAKWLFTDSKLLIFDEPTRGIDIGAKSEIYQLMNALVANGRAILMISSELPEIMGMSDRIYVMHEGRITGEVARADATQEGIMHLATGGE